jgi:hypothetical protein
MIIWQCMTTALILIMAQSFSTETCRFVDAQRPAFRRKPQKKYTRNSVTYTPGELSVREEGLLLSTGLRCKVIARTGEYVTYGNGVDARTTIIRSSLTSSTKFHERPDGGAVFAMPEEDEGGGGSASGSGSGWVYVSNSESRTKGGGGVGAITFDPSGNVTNYKMVLEGTTKNCQGGTTPWNTW